MRNHALYSLLGIGVLLCVDGCRKPEITPPPVIGLEKTELTASASGGDVVVGYSLENAVEGAEISVTPAGSYEWVLDTEVEPSAIRVSLAENETTDPREAEFSVTYPGMTEKVAFTITQDAGPAVVYDYEYDMPEFYMEYYKNVGNDDEDNFYIFISDIPMSESGFPQPGGIYYVFDMYAAPDTGPVIPAGVYPIDPSGSTAAGTCAQYSEYYKYHSDDYDDPENEESFFVDGALTVTKDGDIYTFDAKVTDDRGLTHHVTYTGPAAIIEEPEPEPGYDPIEEPVDFTASLASALYVEDNAEVMAVTMQFTDMEVDSEGYLVPPGTLLTLDVYMPYDPKGNLSAGTYHVDNTLEAFTMSSGMDFLGYPVGSYASYLPDGYTELTGHIVAGSMEITENPVPGSYTVVCDLVTAEDVSIKCTYSGSLAVQGIYDSTLDGDYGLDLDGAAGEGLYMGNYYGTGAAWMLNIVPSTVPGDGVTVELVAVDDGFEAGIPSGTYVSAGEGEPGPGEYIPGYVEDGYIYGTSYVHYRSMDSEGASVDGLAPAVDGDIMVTNNGDGTYDISFECTDDIGNVWSGSWSGEVVLEDYSGMRGTKATVSRGAVTSGQKAERIGSAGFKYRIAKKPLSEYAR